MRSLHWCRFEIASSNTECEIRGNWPVAKKVSNTRRFVSKYNLSSNKSLLHYISRRLCILYEALSLRHVEQSVEHAGGQLLRLALRQLHVDVRPEQAHHRAGVWAGAQALFVVLIRVL